ncbi:MAG TPA: SigE family RNA polymerase sigma factor [Kineosporiaceae bacterium]|nr:SigE family RNA polymerase sigma factor [Kineosporiaceae bacterium]
MEFDEYVAARGPALERYAFVLTGDAQRSQDLVQTALVKAYRRWRWVVRAGHPDAYVRRIVTTSYLDWRRLRSSGERPVETLPDVATTDADPADRVADRDELRRALATLTPQQRAVLVLRHYEGYDDAAIAAVLGCSEGTVRAHASRGGRRLREALQQTRLTEDPR